MSPTRQHVDAAPAAGTGATDVAATAPPSPVAAVRAALERIATDDRPGIWIERVDPQRCIERAEAVEAALADGADLPLAGRTVAVKNNVDVAGVRTTAGCPTFGTVPDADAPVVQALVDAGAVVVGVTNLDQFATGLVGTRSPHGVAPNAHWPGRIAGGSSSGSAVAVAAGLVDLAIGTDTAGSGRVPAAANGIVGCKPTRDRVPGDGIVPACASFDCPSLFARDVGVLATALATWTGDPPRAGGVPAGARIAVPDAAQLTHDGDERAARAHAQAVAQLCATVDATPVAFDLEPFLATGRMLYDGAFVRERYEAVGAFIETDPPDLDPIVAGIIRSAARIDTAQLDEDWRALAARRAETATLWAHADVAVVPTCPRIPTVAEVAAAPIAVNSMLGTYTNCVNLLGLCAVSVPVRTEADGGGPPASLMLLAPAGGDELLLALAAALI